MRQGASVSRKRNPRVDRSLGQEDRGFLASAATSHAGGGAANPNRKDDRGPVQGIGVTTVCKAVWAVKATVARFDSWAGLAMASWSRAGVFLS
jgi:hypothetical protein